MKILIAIKPNSQLFTTSLKDGLDGIGCDVNMQTSIILLIYIGQMHYSIDGHQIALTLRN